MGSFDFGAQEMGSLPCYSVNLTSLCALSTL